MPVQIGELTLQRIHRIVTLEEAAFVHHRVPGLEGDVLQNLGRRSVRLQIEGIFYGPEAKDGLDGLRALYTAREPVDFIADVVGQTYVSRVALDRLEVAEAAHDPDQFSYTLTVAEYVEPPQQSTALEAVNQSVQLDAAALLDIATLPEMLSLGSLPDVTNPFVPLKSALEPVAEASKALQSSMSGLKLLLGA
jgi:hypothetical protein